MQSEHSLRPPPLHSPPRTTVEFGVADWTAARLTKARELFHIWIV